MRRRIVRDKSCGATGQQGESGSTASDEVKGNEREEDEEEKIFSSLSLFQLPHFTAAGHSLHPEASRHFNKAAHWSNSNPCQPQRFILHAVQIYITSNKCLIINWMTKMYFQVKGTISSPFLGFFIQYLLGEPFYCRTARFWFRGSESFSFSSSLSSSSDEDEDEDSAAFLLFT